MKGKKARLITASSMLLITSGLVLAGCEGVKQDLGIGVKRPPDEFAVFARAPLSMPPDYGLRPPTPGAPSESLAARESAKDVIVSQGAASSPAGSSLSGAAKGVPGSISAGGAPRAAPATGASPGTMQLLDRTGGLTAQSSIREQVNRESTVLADADQSFVERLMFWSDKPDPGTVVDAPQEAKRIRQTQALGEPIVTGETPTIERRPKALLEGIFN